MNTKENIERLEKVLTSTFWRDDMRKYVSETLTLQIIDQGGNYRWRIDDADDESQVDSDRNFASLPDAKDSLRRALENGLRRHRLGTG